jgi:hypothetical protein
VCLLAKALVCSGLVVGGALYIPSSGASLSRFVTDQRHVGQDDWSKHESFAK